MPGIVIAWLAGETIIIYRSYKQTKRPPMPGQLLASTILFAVLGGVAQNQRLSFLANALAWGFDVAAFLNLSQTAPLAGDLQKLAASGSKGAAPVKKGATA